MSVSGKLGHFDLVGILQLLANSRATGRLTIAAGGDEVALFLDLGQLVQVSSARLPLRLGRVLRRQGLVSEEQLGEVLKIQ